jgi:tetratricopeptide (TPR) repeat protein
VALFGRFSPGMREHLASAILSRGGRAQRDLMRGGDFLVVGAYAISLIDTGALLRRLEVARRRGLAVFGEASFRAALENQEAAAPTFPLASALSQSGAERDDADLLAAFDLLQIRKEYCRFGDVGVLKTMAELRAAGCLPARAIRILLEAHALAPLGRHKVVLDVAGAPALLWEDGITTLDGQRFLPINLEPDRGEDLFEAAMAAEAEGDLIEAERLYDACARADRSDGVALYNCGNIRLGQQRYADAIVAYRAALARDPDLVEAHYNLAQALEAVDDNASAASALAEALRLEPNYADAVFNLAQLRLGEDDTAGAATLFERYIALQPPPEWREKARRALTVCRVRARSA